MSRRTCVSLIRGVLPITDKMPCCIAVLVPFSGTYCTLLRLCRPKNSTVGAALRGRPNVEHNVATWGGHGVPPLQPASFVARLRSLSLPLPATLRVLPLLLLTLHR